ncbi:hypothetical protein M422DRAFT_38949, partial [Sphaerobolus stellatus SS14]
LSAVLNQIADINADEPPPKKKRKKDHVEASGEKAKDALGNGKRKKSDASEDNATSHEATAEPPAKKVKHVDAATSSSATKPASTKAIATATAKQPEEPVSEPSKPKSSKGKTKEAEVSKDASVVESLIETPKPKKKKKKSASATTSEAGTLPSETATAPSTPAPAPGPSSGEPAVKKKKSKETTYEVATSVEKPKKKKAKHATKDSKSKVADVPATVIQPKPTASSIVKPRTGTSSHTVAPIGLTSSSVPSQPIASKTASSTKEATKETCPVCAGPFHFRYKCPVITAGIESMQKRRAELIDTGSRPDLVRELDVWIIKASKEAEATQTVDKDTVKSTTTGFEAPEEKEDSERSAPALEETGAKPTSEEPVADPNYPPIIPRLPPLHGSRKRLPSRTPSIVPPKSLISEVAVETQDEGSESDTSSSSSSSSDSESDAEPSGDDPSGMDLDNVDVDALTRGPVFKKKGKHSILDQLEEAEKSNLDDDERDEEGLVEEEEQEVKRGPRKSRGLRFKSTSPETMGIAEEDDESDEDDLGMNGLNGASSTRKGGTVANDTGKSDAGGGGQGSVAGRETDAPEDQVETGDEPSNDAVTEEDQTISPEVSDEPIEDGMSAPSSTTETPEKEDVEMEALEEEPSDERSTTPDSHTPGEKDVAEDVEMSTTPIKSLPRSSSPELIVPNPYFPNALLSPFKHATAEIDRSTTPPPPNGSAPADPRTPVSDRSLQTPPSTIRRMRDRNGQLRRPALSPPREEQQEKDGQVEVQDEADSAPRPETVPKRPTEEVEEETTANERRRTSQMSPSMSVIVRAAMPRRLHASKAQSVPPSAPVEASSVVPPSASQPTPKRRGRPPLSDAVKAERQAQREAKVAERKAKLEEKKGAPSSRTGDKKQTEEEETEVKQSSPPPESTENSSRAPTVEEHSPVDKMFPSTQSSLSQRTGTESTQTIVPRQLGSQWNALPPPPPSTVPSQSSPQVDELFLSSQTRQSAVNGLILDSIKSPIGNGMSTRSASIAIDEVEDLVGSELQEEEEERGRSPLFEAGASQYTQSLMPSRFGRLATNGSSTSADSQESGDFHVERAPSVASSHTEVESDHEPERVAPPSPAAPPPSQKSKARFPSLSQLSINKFKPPFLVPGRFTRSQKHLASDASQTGADEDEDDDDEDEDEDSSDSDKASHIPKAKRAGVGRKKRKGKGLLSI